MLSLRWVHFIAVNRQAIKLLENSDLFDSEWYCQQYPDVPHSRSSAARDYLYSGAIGGRNPSPDFDSVLYMQENPDVAKAEINPLVHYIKWGQKEGRCGPGNKKLYQENIELILNSELFDADWYNKAYPDVAESDMDAADHFLRYGGHEKLNPGPDFDMRFYTNEYPDVQKSLIHPFLHYLRFGIHEGRDIKGSVIASKLELDLWGGFSNYAIPELENLKLDACKSSLERERAAWYLMRWYGFHGEHTRAYKNAQISMKARPSQRKHFVAIAMCLVKLGRHHEASHYITKGIERFGLHRDFYILNSTIMSRLNDNGDDVKLSWLNCYLEAESMSPITLKDPSQPISFTNITSISKPETSLQKEKVSIIIPAYNASEMIQTVLESLINQTWKNIEIIVVDDCSTDTTCDVVTEFICSDDRIKLVRKDNNQGAYMARNTGLKHANGDLIMVHDSDDWSHPQKIEVQINELLKSKKYVAVMSHWIRFNFNLDVVGPWIERGDLSDVNFSSLMIRREVFNAIGEWPHVRVSGDAEFRHRILRYYGNNSIGRVNNKKTLSFSLTRPDSLTRTRSTHVKTLYYGLRWQYLDAYTYWHNREIFKESPLGEITKTPIPVGMSPRQTEINTFDLVIYSDYSTKGCEMLGNMSLLQQLATEYPNLAIFHWPLYESGSVQKPVSGVIYDFCVSDGTRIITPTFIGNTKYVILTSPKLLDFVPDDIPDIQSERTFVICKDNTITTDYRNRQPVNCTTSTYEYITQSKFLNIIKIKHEK